MAAPSPVMAAPCRHITRPRCGCAPVAAPPPVEVAPPLTSDEDEAIERAERAAALLEMQRKILRRKARESLYVFFKWAWSVMQPGSPLEDGPHIEALCFHFQTQLEDRGRAIKDPTFKMRAQNMLINVPPRSLKTAILAYATVWAWLHWPTMKIGYLSTNPRVAQNSARVTRDLLAHAKFLDVFRPEWEVRADQDALSDMGNSVGGLRVARGLNSKVTGEGYDWLCVAEDTRISTEVGDVRVDALVRMNPMPSVWTWNHRLGCTELRHVTGHHITPAQQTVTVQTSTGHVLRCTDDHRVWTSEGYTEAARIAGRTVSVVPRPDDALAGTSAPLHHMLAGDPDVRHVRGDVREGRGRGGQGDASLQLGPVLFAGVQPGRPPAPARRVSRVSADVRPAGIEEPVLFEDLLRAGALARDTADAGRQAVFVLPDDDAGAIESAPVLLAYLPEPGTRRAHDRVGEFELQWTGQAVLRGPLGESGAADQGARRASLYGVRWDLDEDAGGTPHRPRPHAQHAGESDHAVRRVPHDAPQVQGATVLSVDRTLEGGRVATVDVYDINVEGNHNFFANGVLVHNCIDDPHDLKDSKQEIESANEEYNASVHNRINSPSTSIRTCIMQRVKPYDLAAIFIRSGQWLHVRMPMEYEPNATCPCGKCTGVNVYGWKDWRTVAGEVLHPRFTEEFLKAERHPDRLNEFGYAAQMQQRPESPGGGSIKRAYWRFCRVADFATGGWPRPPGCQGTGEGETPEEPFVIRRERDGSLRLNYIYISVDAAAKRTARGSNYGMLAIGGFEARVVVLDDRTRRGGFDEILDVLRDMIKLWRPTSMLIEAKAAGGPILETLEKELLQGKIRDDNDQPIYVRLEAIEPDGDKEARVDACLHQLKGRYVHLLEGADWLDEFVREMADFPNGNYNDRVDALSQALTWARDHTVDDLYKIPM